MLDQFIGIVKLFAGDFAPIGWVFCNGQLLNINEYEALYTIIGTTYGGDGVRTFAVPNLNGRVPLGTGPSTSLGEAAGTEMVTLTSSQLPAHSHTYNALSGDRETADPRNNFLGITSGPFYGQADPGDQLLPMNSNVISYAPGGSGSHANMSPYLTLNFVIAVEGLYPSRG